MPSRKHTFEPSAYAAVRVEPADAVANLKADLTAVFQAVNFQELFALERMAISQLALLRSYCLESGLVTFGLEAALEVGGTPRILTDPELTNGIKVTAGQNHSYWMAAGFCELNTKAPNWQLFLRYQAQTERLYRRAIEEFERLRSLRDVLPNEVIVEPEPPLQPPLADPPDLPPPPQKTVPIHPRPPSAPPPKLKPRPDS